MKIIICGAKGQLGSELCDSLKREYGQIYCFGKKNLDITNKSKIDQIFEKVNPDVVINCAAYTNVDDAEIEREKAYAVNCIGAGYLAESCKKHDAYMIHFSTDFVFSGQKTDQYDESDNPAPINYYGQSKLAGENKIINYKGKYLIIRTSWLFSIYGNNFVKSVLKLLSRRSELHVVDDQLGSPTWSFNLVLVIKRILSFYQAHEFLPIGLYHYADSPPTNRYMLALEIQNLSKKENIIKKEVLIKPTTSLKFKARAARPDNSSLNCRKICETFSFQQSSYRQGLSEVVSIWGSINESYY